MAVGAINITLGATVGGFVSAMGTARAAVSQLTSDLNGKLITAFNNADRQSRFFERGIGRLGTGLQDVGSKLSTLVTLPLAGLGAAAYKTYADINALQLGLENITGSAAAAKARFEELKEVARLPGLGLEEAVQGDVRLQAVGFSAETSKRALLEFGNALALTGGGRVELDAVITQLSQMGSSAKVLAEDLKPILRASPAVAKAVRGMFGTVSSEAISKQLTAAGKGPADFIKELIESLSGLERVKGGPKNAIENFGDSIKLAAFSFGEAADKALNMTGLLTRVGDAAGQLAKRFAELPTGTQSAIIGVTGFAAAIGPLTLGIGSLVKLMPVISSGFALLGGPIGIAAAAVVGATALIVTNWDKLKVYWEQLKQSLAKTGVWSTVQNVVSSAMEAIGAVSGAYIGYITEVWNGFKGYLIPTAKYIFGVVAEVFKVGMGILSGIFKAITAVFTLDWSKLRDAMQNITISLWNGVIGLTSKSIAFVGSLFAAFLKTVGASDLSSALSANLDRMTAGAERMKYALKGVNQAAQETKKNMPSTSGITLPEVTVLGRRPTRVINQPGKKNEADSAIEKLNKQLSATEERLQSLRLVAPFSFALRQAEYLRAELLDLKKVADPDFKLPKRDTPGEVEMIHGRFDFKSSLNVQNAILPLNAKAAAAQVGEVSSSIVTAIGQLGQEVSNAFRGAAASAAEGVGELVGGLMSGTASLASIPALFGNILGNLAQQIGKSMIAFGTSGLAIKNLIKDPALAIVAGAGLIAVGAALKNTVSNSINSIPKFADGGIVSGPTLGLVGEYANARSNPEVIAPLDKLKRMVGGGTQVFIPEMRLAYDALYIAFKRGERDDYEFN
ncbi:tape measure protein [Larkinella insperata]|uniref:Tape measure protein n=1 Tax=Larkinella insperata TaxID=332158 RepID=A0ABW3Q487_9BACT|nr:tape measure protein [Larkinella insperata]